MLVSVRGLLEALVALSLPAAAAKLPTIWEVGINLGHVETRHDAPEPKELFDIYINGRKGHPDEKDGKWKRPHGRVVLIKGAAARMPAFKKWATDELLMETYGKEKLDQVETEKVETRLKYPHDNWDVTKFLKNYNKSEVYSTAVPPRKMQEDLYLLPSLNCGGYHKRIQSSVLWFSSGGTKSVIHSDGGFNQHCMFSGRKRWIFWHPTQHTRSEKELGWLDGEKASKTEPEFKDAYGSWYGRVDYGAMDVNKYPGWKKMEYYTMDMEAGDCALIPGDWLHYVESPKDVRSVSAHVWLTPPRKFDPRGCEALQSHDIALSEYVFQFSKCTMGYNDPDKNVKATK